MEEAGEHLRCVHLVHAAGARGEPEPTLLCSCPAGLIHMHDCPVSMGRACVHFAPRAGAPAATPAAELEVLHDRLMEDFLTRPYFARVRALAPGGGGRLERRRALEEDYAAFLRDVEDESEVGGSDADYERERERLREQRRRAEEARAGREQGLDAAERARRGIKTVVERAQETVAASGNVASSYVDAIELPGNDPSGGAGAREGVKRRRRRRGKRGGGGGGAPPSP
jgi:hypothetical protein